METPTIKSILTEISEGKGAYNEDRLLVDKTTGFMSQEVISSPNYHDFIQIRLEKPKEG